MSVKVFNLRCEHDHAFEGWFRSVAAFDEQLADGSLQCPSCGSTSISKALSAPRINLGAQQHSDATSEKQAAVMPTPQQMQMLLLKMAREIAAKSEDVGERFPEEARRIHYKEAPERGIRGVASKDEAQALEEEGINVMPLPFAHLLKEPVQ